METDENPNPTTEIWQKAFERSKKNHPNETIYHELPPVGQSEPYSCGPAVLTSVVKRITGKDIQEEVIIESARQKLQSSGNDIEETGVPPEVMQAILDKHYIEYSVKESDESFTDTNVLKAASNWLDGKLDSGVVAIPIQSTPDRIYDTDGVVETESELVDKLGLDGYNRQRKDRTLRSTGSTKDDVTYNGHWILVVGKMVDDAGHKRYLTVDPFYANEEGKGIDPEKQGVRVITDSLLLRNWHDVSGIEENGEYPPFNQYGIHIPLNLENH